jgi:hypothetical protein
MLRCAAAAVVLCIGAPLAVRSEVSPRPRPAGLFAVYADNRERGVPSFVTADLLVLAYSMVRNATAAEAERALLEPKLRVLLRGLAEQLAKLPDAPAGLANRDFLAVLSALLEGAGEPKGAGDADRARRELALALDAREITPSPLWGVPMDYSQLTPRGRHAESAEAQRLFRALRYASLPLFAFQPSAATGVTPELADRFAEQAVGLSKLVSETDALARAYAALEQALAWSYGPADDLTLEDVRVATGEAAPAATGLRERLVARAHTNGRRPRILAGVVDRSRLEPGVSAQDALTGWRLLPLRYTAESAAFQALVYDSVGPFEGAPPKQPPLTLAVIDGKPVKAFPRALELAALLGSRWAREALRRGGDDRYQGYADAFGRAQAELGRATGLNATHLALMRTWLGPGGSEEARPERRAELMAAFWTLERRASVLYSKQSYTLTGKGVELPAPRPGAWLEPAPVLYLALAHLVAQHRVHSPHASWDALATLLDRSLAITQRELQTGRLDPDDEAFLNELDADLVKLTGGPDHPMAVDVHTTPATGEVLEEAVAARSECIPREGSGEACGARLEHFEFRHPLADRLTDEAWRQRLESQDAAS